LAYAALHTHETSPTSTSAGGSTNYGCAPSSFAAPFRNDYDQDHEPSPVPSAGGRRSKAERDALLKDNAARTARLEREVEELSTAGENEEDDEEEEQEEERWVQVQKGDVEKVGAEGKEEVKVIAQGAAPKALGEMTLDSDDEEEDEE
jgi:TolA-binding protein